MIEAKDLSLTYKDGTVALKQCSLRIEKGELVYITGPSGSGKTSLMKMLIGRQFPTAGQLEINGTMVHKGNLKGIRQLRRSIGPVFQEFRLIPGKTAVENVMLALRLMEDTVSDIRQESIKVLTSVGLGHKLNTMVDFLSYGECQRVAIARAVARKPSIILADEPTGNLDHDNAVHIMELLTSYCNKETTVIITTHATHLILEDPRATYITLNKGELMVKKPGDRI